MTNKFYLKFQWCIICFLSLSLIVGTSVLMFSKQSLIVPISLNPNDTIEIPVFRLFPDILRMKLLFDNQTGKERPELGSYTYRGDFKKLGYFEFNNPGEPVILNAQILNKQLIYEAEPVGSAILSRGMTPFIDDGFPNRFPIQLGPFLNIPSGNSTIKVTVTDVGPTIKGEHAKLVIEAPISFISYYGAYGPFWWFYFWPFYVLVLFVYFIFLLRLTYYKRTS